MSDAEKYETWAIVELLGHKRLAGFVTEQAIAGASLVRIDVPATPADVRWSQEYPATQAYTKLVGVGSIYAITPCDEAVARAAAREIERDNNPLPVSLPRQLALPSSDAVEDNVEFDDDEEGEEAYAEAQDDRRAAGDDDYPF